MDTITIKNCNNIKLAEIPLEESEVTVLFGANGVGKSTIAAAIEAQCKDDSETLEALTPYQGNGAPLVNGINESTVAVFNEDYIENTLFQDESNLMGNGYRVFIETDEYKEAAAQTEEILENAREKLEKAGDIDDLLAKITNLLSCFGKAKDGYAKSSAIGKSTALNGDIVNNIPEEFKKFKPLIQSDNAKDWISWHEKGTKFSEYSICPYCGQPIDDAIRENCADLSDQYGNKYLDHRYKVFEAFNNMNECFSDEANKSIKEYLHSPLNKRTTDEDKKLLALIKKDAELLKSNLENLNSLDFLSLRNIENKKSYIENQLIQLEKLGTLNSPYIQEKAKQINHVLEELLGKISKIQETLGVQESTLQNNLKKSRDDINDFLHVAGFPYEFDVDLQNENSCVVILKPRGIDKPILQPQTRLSYGERNALAVALFSSQIKNEKPDLTIIDDPISSFDQNKKYAIIQRLFSKKHGVCKDFKTLLLTHDPETLIMLERIHKNRVCEMQFFFLNNRKGIIEPLPIEEKDIDSSIEMLKHNLSNENPLVCRLVYARQLAELIEGKSEAWNLLSSALHRSATPCYKNKTQLNEEEIKKGIEHLQRIGLNDFDYKTIQDQLKDEDLLEQYDTASTAFEKLCIFRILANDNSKMQALSNGSEENIVFEFASEFFHTENLLIYQFDPNKYDQIPSYIIELCDELIEKYKK